MASPPSFVYQHFDTILLNRDGETGSDFRAGTGADSREDTALPDVSLGRPQTPQQRGVFAYIIALNKLAIESFQKLDTEIERTDTAYHRKFLELVPLELVPDEPQLSQYAKAFVLSLDQLPELPSIGWRIGRGRRKLKNLGVDLLLPTDDENESDIAGLHARLSWVKGGGGFFVIADNQRGMPVNLNGENLSYSQRLIPYNNTIGIGQFFFSIKFLERNPAQEEEFQSQLLLMYSAVLRENTPFIMPTPSRNEMRIGEWVVRKPIARGSFGHVSSVTHAHTGKLAAAKELWLTPNNELNVVREVTICMVLKQLTEQPTEQPAEQVTCNRLAIPFAIYHEKIFNSIERNRIISLLDETWRPNPNDTIDRYILYSPLATSNFYALITSDAPREIRVELFAQVLEGIAFLHQNKIAHRDIKPSNLAVIAFDPPQAQILDFGCATLTNPTLYDRPGTIPYLAPEQEEGKYHNRSVDYWAVALVGLEVLGFRHRGRVDAKQHPKCQEWLEEHERTRSPHPIVPCCKDMLKLNPEHRMTAEEALSIHLSAHRYDSSLKEGKRYSTPPARRGRNSPGV